MTPRIGVLGASGAVGRYATRILARYGTLRLGGRTPVPAEIATGPEGRVAIERVVVDVTDTAAVATFAAGCAVVLDCTGASFRDGGRVAEAVLASGARHVDAGEPPHGSTQQEPPGGARSLTAAGMSPGLSGLLPRRVCAGFAPGATLTCWLAVRDRLSPTAATELLHSITDGSQRALASWRDGAVQPRALTRRDDVDWPLHDEPVTVSPVLTDEHIATARATGLRDGTWWTVLVSPQVRTALDRAPSLPAPDAVEALCRASALDVAGRAPWAVLACEVTGTVAGRPATRTAVLRGPGGAALTGALAAAAVAELLDDAVPPGRHTAAAALDPGRALDRVCTAGGATLEVVDGPLTTVVDVEEFVL
ncbi:hypothetical protein [Pseudonocardia sp. NPDC046786]|uniref:hypothetical protein n=1 Tax=Pseudonocardia sp. NPDC046786 TaxID=3155471 RepID=UPI0033C7BB42